MAKTNAERVKKYRERKIAELGQQEFLRRERERVKKYYRPTCQLNRNEKTERRERNRRNVKAFRERRKQSEDTEGEASSTEDGTVHIEDEYGVSSTSSAPLVVKLPALPKVHYSRKKTKQSLKRANKKIHQLEIKNKILNKRLNSAKKRLEREKAKSSMILTPRRKTERMLRKAGVSERKGKDIKKKLLLAECLTKEIQEAKEANPTKRGLIRNMVSGKIIRKYRLSSLLHKTMGINRKKASNKSLQAIRKSRLLKYRTSITKELQDFFERDDNSRCLPGKADAKKLQGQNGCTTSKKQKRVLNDHLKYLHEKYQSESMMHRVPFSTFCKARPSHISLVNFASCSSCLCSKHQNFALKLRCLKSLGVDTTTSPDRFVEVYHGTGIKSLLDGILSDDVTYKEWQRVKLPDGKERTRMCDVEKTRDEFKAVMEAEFVKFTQHVQRVKDQYSAIKHMKENLPLNHALVHMDFAENYSCQSMESIQSAYWNSAMVTLHPCIIYYKTQEQLLHESTVFVSDVLHHNSTMVHAILQKLSTVVKDLNPEVTHIHYWTDSPTSQYRNKTIFDIICHHDEMFGVRASWQYFESGHGKGPCDGIGGTTKRNADNAVKQGKACIQDAHDFFQWADKESKSQIKYIFVTQEEYDESHQFVEGRSGQIKPVKGTMKFHAVVGLSNGQIAARAVSCVCSDCFGQEDGFKPNAGCGWETHKLNKEMEILGNTQKEHDEGPSLNITTGKFVAAAYDGKPYIGKALETDENEALISFMEKSGKIDGHFRWPRRPDEIWVPNKDILCLIPDPLPMGKTQRVFSYQVDIMEMINNKLQNKE